MVNLPLPGPSIAPPDLAPIEGYEIAGLLDIDNRLPVAIVTLAPDHPAKQLVVALSGYFEVVQIPSGGFFHGNALDPAAGTA